MEPRLLESPSFQILPPSRPDSTRLLSLVPDPLSPTQVARPNARSSPRGSTPTPNDRRASTGFAFPATHYSGSRAFHPQSQCRRGHHHSQRTLSRRQTARGSVRLGHDHHSHASLDDLSPPLGAGRMADSQRSALCL